MSYTDPSGYMFSSLRRHTKANLRGLGRNETFNGLVTLALSYVCGPCVSIYVGAQAYAVTGSLSEGIRAGVKSYATSLGHQLVGLSLDPGVGNAFANALVGGISAELSGGKFGHGFLAAGLVAGLKGPDSDFGIGTKPSLRFARVAIAAVVGGTVSELTGGKFRNGALTGAMTQLFNAENRIERDNNAQKGNELKINNKRLKAKLRGFIEGEINRNGEASILLTVDEMTISVNSSGEWEFSLPMVDGSGTLVDGLSELGLNRAGVSITLNDFQSGGFSYSATYAVPESGFFGLFPETVNLGSGTVRPFHDLGNAIERSRGAVYLKRGFQSRERCIEIQASGGSC